MYKTRIKNLTLIALFLALFSCGAIRHAEDEEYLHNRVEKYWKAKMEGDSETLYNMTVKSYREKVELKKFLKSPLLDISNFSIKEIKINFPKALVTVDYKFNHQGFEFNPVSKWTWVFENGDWFLEIEPVNMPFGANPNQ